MSFGRRCPRCGKGTHRQRTPLWARPLRAITLHRCSHRNCPACGWNGLAFHRRSRPVEKKSDGAATA